MYLPPYVPDFHPMFAHWVVMLNRLPGGGMEDILCGWAHGAEAANASRIPAVDEATDGSEITGSNAASTKADQLGGLGPR